MSDQFSTAYDVYLEILHRVDLHVNEALGRGKGWRLRNACPACFYTLEGEPELDYSFMATMDGNNSAKRVNEFLRGRLERMDSRPPRDDRWLSPKQVNKFADEVASRSVCVNSCLARYLLKFLISLKRRVNQ